ncbi:helix-turn-helix transcriptional regulator (plasmid) [Clostridium baratii]
MKNSLKGLREEKMLSQREVVSLMGNIYQSSMSLIENGKLALEFGEAKKLSGILGVTLDELFEAYSVSRGEIISK